MSAVCDFYIDCASRGLCPVAGLDPLPAGIVRRTITVESRRGEPVAVEGIDVEDAVILANAGTAPDGVREFLATFCGYRSCHDCGCVAGSWYFVNCGDAIRCVDCE